MVLGIGVRQIGYRSAVIGNLHSNGPDIGGGPFLNEIIVDVVSQAGDDIVTVNQVFDRCHLSPTDVFNGIDRREGDVMSWMID